MLWLMVERRPGQLLRISIVKRVLIKPVQFGNMSTVTVCGHYSILWYHYCVVYIDYLQSEKITEHENRKNLQHQLDEEKARHAFGIDHFNDDEKKIHTSIHSSNTALL